jgi:hypothetical protein
MSVSANKVEQIANNTAAGVQELIPLNTEYSGGISG